jgi:hypothetical protein
MFLEQLTICLEKYCSFLRFFMGALAVAWDRILGVAAWY